MNVALTVSPLSAPCSKIGDILNSLDKDLMATEEERMGRALVRAESILRRIGFVKSVQYLKISFQAILSVSGETDDRKILRQCLRKILGCKKCADDDCKTVKSWRSRCHYLDTTFSKANGQLLYYQAQVLGYIQHSTKEQLLKDAHELSELGLHFVSLFFHMEEINMILECVNRRTEGALDEMNRKFFDNPTTPM